MNQTVYPAVQPEALGGDPHLRVRRPVELAHDVELGADGEIRQAGQAVKVQEQVLLRQREVLLKQAVAGNDIDSYLTGKVLEPLFKVR